MCIILIKPEGTKLPSSKLLKNAWNNNNHGAGFCYPEDNQVHIKKGYMSLESLLLDLEKVDNNLSMILHFRTGTSGTLGPEATHPFPILNDIKALKALDIETDYGLAHNGIFNINNIPTESDTMEYCKQISQFKDRGDFYDIIERSSIGNKIAVMDKTGKVDLFGNFITDGKYQWSNNGYKIFWNYVEYCTTCSNILMEVGDFYYCEICDTFYQEVTMLKEVDIICPKCDNSLIPKGLNLYCPICREYHKEEVYEEEYTFEELYY